MSEASEEPLLIRHQWRYVWSGADISAKKALKQIAAKGAIHEYDVKNSCQMFNTGESDYIVTAYIYWMKPTARYADMHLVTASGLTVEPITLPVYDRDSAVEYCNEYHQQLPGCTQIITRNATCYTNE